MSKRSVDSLLPTETLELDNGLSLVPRVKLLLTIHPSDNSGKPLDEWKLKQSLINFLKTSFSVTVPEDDLEIRKFKDMKKRKREDPVARGNLFIRDLGFLSKSNFNKFDGKENDDVKVVEKKLFEWRRSVVEKMGGIELNIVGVKFRLSVEVSPSDDFHGLRKEWEELNAFSGERGYQKGGKQQPGSIMLRGVPSRWFAETRVSSKPSTLVTHTIFSALGKIRNLDVAEDDDIGKDVEEEDGGIVSGLHCKIVVQFEDYREFCSALKILCGRSLQKEGSRLRADYEVSWDKDGFFSNARSRTEDNSRWMPRLAASNYRSGAPGHHQSHVSHFSANNSRSKRFKD